MLDRRWWDAAVIAASLAIAVAMTVGLVEASPIALWIAAAALVLFAATYLLVARPGLRDPRPWRLPVFAVLAALALAVGCAVQPFFAIAQAIAYPLVWVLATRRRPAIAGSAVVAFGIFVGVALFAGVFEGDALAALGTALASAVFGLGFAIAFGLWVTSIVEYGEERAQLVAELTAAQGQVEALSRERGASEERERLARDIHDTLAQTLAGLVILAERAGRQSKDGQMDAATATIATVEQVARDALGETRALVARTAAVPGEPALEAAVQRLVERFRAQSAAAIELDVTALAADPDRETQVVLLRCLQEALSNVSKHAGADTVSVRLWTTGDGEAGLMVVDDGAGFDADAASVGFGLDGMRERVALAGGALDLESAPGRTALRVTLTAGVAT